MLNDEVKELFEDPDFGKTIKILADQFGTEATLKDVHDCFEQNRPVPEKTINGKRYFAGYRGAKMVSPGMHSGKLIDIKQNGNNCKMMFSIDGNDVFLYHNIPKDSLRVEQIIKLGSKLGEIFPVHVKYETIPTTGDRHAVIDNVMKLEC